MYYRVSGIEATALAVYVIQIYFLVLHLISVSVSGVGKEIVL